MHHRDTLLDVIPCSWPDGETTVRIGMWNWQRRDGWIRDMLVNQPDTNMKTLQQLVFSLKSASISRLPCTQVNYSKQSTRGTPDSSPSKFPLAQLKLSPVSVPLSIALLFVLVDWVDLTVQRPRCTLAHCKIFGIFGVGVAEAHFNSWDTWRAAE